MDATSSFDEAASQLTAGRGARHLQKFAFNMLLRAPTLAFLFVALLWSVAAVAALRGPVGVPQGQHWSSVSEVTSCDGVADELCKGAAGFRVDQNGHFVAGPAPDGATVEGGIETAELVELSAAANRVAQRVDPLSARDCEAHPKPPIPEPPVIRGYDLMRISFGSHQNLAVYDVELSLGNLCYLPPRDAVVGLHSVFHALLAKYYPKPFPNATSSCLTALYNLRRLYRDVSTCEFDGDCRYVDGFFTVISRLDGNRFVHVFECGNAVPYLVAANGRLVAENLAELYRLERATSRACALPASALTCDSYGGFLSSPPPVCVSGKCAAPANAP